MFALSLYGSPDVLIDSDLRTEILFNLIALFEHNGLRKFRIYASENISIK